MNLARDDSGYNFRQTYGGDTEVNIPAGAEVGPNGEIPDYRVNAVFRVTGGNIPEGTAMEIEVFEFHPTLEHPLKFQFDTDFANEYPWPVDVSFGVEKAWIKQRDERGAIYEVRYVRTDE